MTIRRIDHVQLAMPAGAEEKARAFYDDILGISETPKPPHLAVRGGAWFERGNLKVHLGVDKNFSPATKAHVAFEVDDLQSLIMRCKTAGYKVVDDEPLEGYDRAYVSDPFGNRLEFMQPL